MRRLGLDLDRYGDVDAFDVPGLTQTQAVDIFIKHYFDASLVVHLLEPLHARVFNMYVNAGGNAIKVLQRLLWDMGFKVSVDGAFGPQSLDAVRAASKQANGYLVDAYGIARRNYYPRIADRHPASRKYARTRAGQKGGWIRRAEEFMAPKFHMNQSEFQKRVASWA